LLSTIQGIIMVAGAVIVSSQTTTVRASNLLASFIIVPMALLIQGEAAALFWGNYAGLWWLIFGLLITAAVLIRMGLNIFNREQLMGQEIDNIRLRWMWRQFWNKFSGRSDDGSYPRPAGWFKQTVAILPALRLPIVGLLIAMLATFVLVSYMARSYPMPPDMQAELTGDNLLANLSELEGLISALPGIIIFQNVRAILLQALLGVFTFGVLGVLIFVLPWGVIGFIAAQFSIAGENPLAFVLATVVPHAVIELPALLIAGAAAWRWHATVISPPPDRTLGEAFLWAFADFSRVAVGLVLPLLVIAAFIEAYVTPLVLAQVYGS